MISLSQRCFLLLCLSALVVRSAEGRDAKWAEQIEEKRKFLTREGRRSLAQNRQNDSETGGDRNLLSSTRTGLNVLVVLMQWTNHPDRNTAIPRESYDKLFNAEGRDDVLYPGGTVKSYFDTMSYGEFSVDFTVTDWIMTDYTEQAFTADGSQGRNQEIQQAFTPVLQALDDADFNFGEFDINFDRKIDLTIFLHSGYDSIAGGTDCETGIEWPQRVASHASSGALNSDWVSKAGFRLDAYVVAPAFNGFCDLEIGRIGTIVHEMIHPFDGYEQTGIPDLYDMDLDYNTGNIGGIDRFGVMANPSGNAGGDLAWPGPVSAWTRITLGWIEPTVIDMNGVYELRPVEEHPEIYKITKGFEDKEYLLLENRQPIEGTFDERFFNPGGIVIYHIDENIWDEFNFGGLPANGPRGGPFQSDWPGNGRHYPIAVLQADGLYELEQGINGGTSDDLWNDPSQVLGPGNGERVVNTATYPNTDSYAFGEIKPTGITIQNFETKEDLTMSFQVCGLSSDDCTAVTTPTPPDTNGPTQTPTESPTERTNGPTRSPTKSPTGGPTASPTNETNETTEGPTKSPTKSPTGGPTKSPTKSPTSGPTKSPTKSPTSGPTRFPTLSPTKRPIVTLENGSCDVAVEAFRPDSSEKGISFISSGTRGKTCYGNFETGVWYKVDGETVPDGETVEANTCFLETEFVNKISVFKGDDCTALECVETKEIACQNGQLGHVVYWEVESDVDYHLFVHTVEGTEEITNDSLTGVSALGAGSLFMEIVNFAPTGNDNCVGATDLSTDGQTIEGTTEQATPESNEDTCGIDSAGVWYKVIGTGSELRATTCHPGTTSTTQIHIFSGSCDSLSCISVEANNYAVCSESLTATNSATVNWQTEEGKEYFVLVGSRDGSGGKFVLSVSEFESVDNDECPNALPFEIPGIEAVVDGSTKDATNDFAFGTEYCGAPLDTAGIWYTVEGTGDGLSVSTCGQNDYNSAISIFTGSDCGKLECLTGVATRDPACDFDGVTATWLSEENQIYHVYVHGSAMNSYGSFELEAKKFESNAVNGFCNQAIEITDEGVNVKSATGEGSHSTSTNMCGGEAAKPGLWYTFEGTGDKFYFSACPLDDIDVSVSFFSGESCGDLTCISGHTFSLEECEAFNSDDNTRHLQGSRFLQESDNPADYTSIDTEEGVTYYMIVQGQARVDPETGEETTGVGSFDFKFFEGVDDEPDDDTKGPEWMTRNRLIYIIVGAAVLLIICFCIPPCWTYCCKNKRKRNRADQSWRESSWKDPTGDLDMEETGFRDERPSGVSTSDHSSKYRSKYSTRQEASSAATSAATSAVSSVAPSSLLEKSDTNRKEWQTLT